MSWVTEYNLQGNCPSDRTIPELFSHHTDRLENERAGFGSG